MGMSVLLIDTYISLKDKSEVGIIVDYSRDLFVCLFVKLILFRICF